MNYIQYGKTELKVSKFGLGCMRFPKDETEAIDMIRYAIDNGVNYLDTAYVYPGSEVITGKALSNGYRDKIHLVTKSPIWNITKHEDFETYLDEALMRLGTDYIDVYLLHNMNPGNWEAVKKYDGFTFLDKMIKKGKIRHKGFSIHNSLKAFKEVVDSFAWDMAQIQLNILGETMQAGVDGLKYAARKGLAVVIMEPLMGGYLLNNVPAEVNELIQSYPEKRSLVEWCFRWLYNMPETSVILSGTSSLAQLKENLRIFDHAAPNVMSDEDQEFIHKIRDAFEAKKSIGCTGCWYCMPCPQGVAIPEIFKLYNGYQLMNDPHDKLMYQSRIIPFGLGADQCISCGICAQNCPQGLKIPELLETAHTELKA
ncbi:putative oxidoreductase of aldo/keto reductase family [Candidatus Desulfosporosinus infrequens]|uniref:Putative oxidoreductase of aldo/keto reductase family n=1 Tax=Candidatus Desulfosporosinus infrequens TaxID=2043169 RepID=A0A2U3L7L1_9FIRM|nr:putative oxidoreductase of aldo/keto reductase family [Candidatus Desulfosporosinus infrequens]